MVDGSGTGTPVVEELGTGYGDPTSEVIKKMRSSALLVSYVPDSSFFGSYYFPIIRTFST